MPDKVFSSYEHSDEVLKTSVSLACVQPPAPLKRNRGGISFEGSGRLHTGYGISIFEIFLKTKFFNMLFFLLRPLRNVSGILLGSRARLDRFAARFFKMI